jgi:hypothetical protein
MKIEIHFAIGSSGDDFLKIFKQRSVLEFDFKVYLLMTTFIGFSVLNKPFEVAFALFIVLDFLFDTVFGIYFFQSLFMDVIGCL